MATLTGANTTAQWFADNFSSSVFSRLEKFVPHTTETGSRTSVGWPGYSGGASAPNATYDPRGRTIRQHFSNNESSRALKDPSGTAVRENRDNVFQLEIICYSQKSLAVERGGLWVGNLTPANYQDLAKIVEQLNRELDLPLQSSVTWGTWTNGTPSSIRLSGPQYDAYKGILGHMHVSGNSHWDPGAFSWTKLEAAITGSGEDFVTTQAEFNSLMSTWWNSKLNPLNGSQVNVPPELRNLRVAPWHQLLGAGPLNMHGVMGELLLST
ncbi:MAG: hypothetical protein ACREOB_01470, partial [Thermodesulfobacteriota bacterium]